MSGKTQWYIGAPNGVVLCINEAVGGELRGEFFHGYSEEGVPFGDLGQMILRMERLYDYLHFPFPGTSERSFGMEKKQERLTTERKRKMKDETLLTKHGDIGTFIVRVQHRQNSSWQGRITWMEEDKTLQFRSVWEMIKMIESAVDTTSVQEDERGESWFHENENEE